MKKPSLLIIFFTVFIDLIGFGIVLPLLPLYNDQFGAPGIVMARSSLPSPSCSSSSLPRGANSRIASGTVLFFW